MAVPVGGCAAVRMLRSRAGTNDGPALGQVLKMSKNPYAAGLLSLLAGPFGLFYVSVKQGALAAAVAGAVGAAAVATGVPLYPIVVTWPLWAVIAANRYNERIAREMDDRVRIERVATPTDYLVWWGGGSRGPFSVEELQALRHEGEIDDDTLYWDELRAQWTPLAELSTQDIPIRQSGPEGIRLCAVCSVVNDGDARQCSECGRPLS